MYPKVDIICEQVLIVQVQVVYQLGFALLYGVYHNAEVTSPQVIQVINQLSLDNWDTQVGIVGTFAKSQYSQEVATAHKQLDNV